MSSPKAIPKALQETLSLPVSLTVDGEMVALSDFVKHKRASYLSLSSLTANQRARIVAERLRREPEVRLATVNAGTINKERAIAEVEAQTPLGQFLIEAEQYVIQKLIEEAKNGRLKDIIEQL